jgi:hypothetical protein
MKESLEDYDPPTDYQNGDSYDRERRLVQGIPAEAGPIAGDVPAE